MEVTIAAVLVLAALLWRKERQHDSILQAQLAERDAWAVERQLLLNRIQAPETAVAQVLAQDIDELPQGLPYDDDQAFHESKKG